MKVEGFDYRMNHKFYKSLRKITSFSLKKMIDANHFVEDDILANEQIKKYKCPICKEEIEIKPICRCTKK